MGNQLGFANRPPPEFIGKSWSYVMEKRRKSIAMKRPNSSQNFTDVYVPNNMINDEIRDDITNLEDFRSRRGASEPNETPPSKPPLPRFSKRRGSIKTRGSTVRCSPTVPDALTLSLDLATAGIGVGLASIAGAEAVASALSAIQKLQPAAPRLFRENVFDDFFEEAERRNLTMEVLQAALAPSTPSDDEEDEYVEPSSQSNEHQQQPRETTKEKRRSPARSLVATSGVRSKEKLNSFFAATSSEEGPGTDRITLNGCTTSSELEAHPNKGRLVVLMAGGTGGGGTSDGESTETDRWDTFPPTIIVQPGPRPLFASSSSLTLTTNAMTTTAANTSGGVSPSRRGSVNPVNNGGACSSPTGALNVRFADQTSPVCWFGESEDASGYRRSNTVVETVRQKQHRTSLRRKTIGGLTLALPVEGAAMSSPDISSESTSVTVMTTSLSRTNILNQKSDDHLRPHSASASQQQLRKKSLSKSDLLCPPPIITLLKQPQMNLIRQLWQQIYNTKGPTVLGNHIFQRVFFKNPSIKDVFRNVDIGNNHINVDSMCKAHAKAVAGVLDDVVKNLENLREVESKLMDIGRKHAIFNDLGFHINFWSVFAEAFIDCTLEWGEKNRRVEESRKAWAIIIAYITDKMKLGFQEARRNLMRPGRGNVK